MKKKKLILIALLISMFFINKPAKSRIMGSDLTWTCIGQDSFLVKLTLYRDCNGVQLPNTVSIPIKCKATNQLITTLTIAKPTPTDITPVCNSSCTRCQSSSCSFPYGIEQYTFQKLAVLSSAGSCCELIMSFQMCCRNSSITTGAANKAFYTFAELNRCLTPCDNSPQFTNPPILVACIGQDFTINHGFFDTDKDSLGRLSDSLVYSWGHPLSDSGSNIPYTGSYTYKKPIYFWGFPNANLPFPRSFHLDLHTGDISFRPMKIEQTVMVTKVEEFRNDTLIGQIRRDIQVIVINCPNNHAPLLSGPFYKEVCAGDSVTFTINTNDYDSNDTLRISWNNAITNATWSSNNGIVKHPTGNFTWVPQNNMASTIPYVFTATVKDDACPVNGSSTRAYQILVKSNPNITISVIDSGCNNFFFKATPTNLLYEWKCFFNPLKSVTASGFNHHFNQFGKFPFQVKAINNQCTNTIYYDTLVIDTFPSAVLPNDTHLCYGNSLNITATISQENYSLRYFWNTADSNVKQITVGPLYADTLIVFSVEDSNNCIYSDSMFIDV
ncbi:MAG: hypothetical protein U9R42_10610, partial [Bacteroidota bacterium]|nr:hypothetical protein [Bacteroidota bacterium]